MAFFFFPSKMFTFGFICSKLQLKSQNEFAIFQQFIFHKHLSPYLKIPVLSNQCQCKTAFAACNFCQNTLSRKIEIKPIVWSLLFYFYVRLHIYFDTERNCLKWKLELIVLRYHLVVAFCIIILTVYSTGCYVKCFDSLRDGTNLGVTDASLFE